jgi:hypothetical protein
MHEDSRDRAKERATISDDAQIQNRWVCHLLPHASFHTHAAARGRLTRRRRRLLGSCHERTDQLRMCGAGSTKTRSPLLIRCSENRIDSNRWSSNPITSPAFEKRVALGDEVGPDTLLYSTISGFRRDDPRTADAVLNGSAW